jgi:hypothetical protein
MVDRFDAIRARAGVYGFIGDGKGKVFGPEMKNEW